MFIGTSWKMNKTTAQAVAWAQEVRNALPDAPTGCQLFVIPPFTAIATVKRELDGTSIWVGAQNVHEQEAGAFTGEISAPMLADLGCDLVEIGHSERRELYNESDEAIAAKVKAILAHGMRPLVCIGESAEVRNAGGELAHVLDQASAALADLPSADLAKCLLAYEPIWSIGVGSTPATQEQIAPVFAALQEKFAGVSLLYGGSVNEENAVDLVSVPGVHGLFIGRAALEAPGFLAVLTAVRAA